MSAAYWRMALDSLMVQPESVAAGTVPMGFIARKEGDLWAAAKSAGGVSRIGGCPT